MVVNMATVASAGQVKSDTAQAKVIADAHIHHGLSHQNAHVKLQNFDFFAQRNVQVISFPMPIRREETGDLISLVEAEIGDMNVLSERNKKFKLISSNSGFCENPNSEQLAVFLSIEYFHGVFNGDPDNVEKYRNLGIRSITIMDNEHDRFFNDDNLTIFGKQIIRQMNAAGVLVDISHLSEQHMIEVIHFSIKPVIASHSGARTVSKNDGGLSDAVLEAMKINGGFVFTTFNKNDLFLPGEEDINGIDKFIEHVAHLIQTLGPDHVGIGSDYQAMGKYVPNALNEINTYQQIQEALQEAGFSESDIESIMSGTFLNALGVSYCS
jgi:microsomal dipeptidase-like Zn-dependent dipeptidase